ncbi:histidine kinase dimerization/phosphoacceptor domain -containing protein [Fluviispira vulneris]|uniref:histidine kinase dimerization/phosphoacceptor domain -containing protein n=1 Tax=Fluviispira vulneris TaxID=2763012 RepID=UPI001648C77C|nr:histidine kinase dimerization/phosphoacceptor domain -containing protein [Fluviispira vulneris]
MQDTPYPSDFCEQFHVQNTDSFQPCGVLLGIDLNGFIIKFASENCKSLFNFSDNNFFKKKLADCISESSFHFIKRHVKNLQSLANEIRVNIQLDVKSENNFIKYHCLSFLTKDILCLEFQLECPIEYQVNQELFDAAYQEITLYQGDLNILAAKLCRFIRFVTNFDRIYYCRFEDDGTGYVPANDATEPLESILHHHFPATDVPAIVRQLYLKSRYRLITEATYTPIKIIGLHEKIDLSMSLFRAIGPTHLQYLKNMGIMSSASFSVVENNTLRGLIGCHSVKRKAIPLEILPKIQLLVELFATRLLDEKLNELQIKAPKINKNIFEFLKMYENMNCDLQSLPKESFALLRNTFMCDNVLYKYENKKITDSNIPDEMIDKIDFFAKKKFDNNEITILNCLSDLHPKFNKWMKEYSGMIYIPLDRDHISYIALFRPEQIQTIKWSGDPSIQNINSDGSLNPRNSFAIWYNQIKGACVPWSKVEISIAKEIRIKLIDIRSNFLEKSIRENLILKEKNDENELLLSEIHHRVKNNLSIVSSIFDWKMKESKNSELISDLKEMKSRVHAISALHETLYQGGNFGSLSIEKYLKSIAREALSLVKNNNTQIDFTFSIPSDLVIPIQEALPLGLITHEFITNSIKHAFNEKDKGLINIEWNEYADTPILTLSDNGKGYVNIEKKQNKSLGLELIRLLVGQLDAIPSWDGSVGVKLKIKFDRKFA